MEITVEHERDQTTQTVIFQGTTVQELLTQLDINPETILVVRNNEVIIETTQLNNQDTLTLLNVISGG